MTRQDSSKSPARGKRKGAKRTAAPVPGREEILDYVRRNPGKSGKREIARAFGMRGEDRLALNEVLKELAQAGLLGSGRRSTALPRVTVLEITGVNEDGDLLARPANWTAVDPPPPITVTPPRARGGRRADKGRRRQVSPSAALGPGDRVLARLKKARGRYKAAIIHRLREDEQKFLGVYSVVAGQGRVTPTARGKSRDYHVALENSGEARPGELVLAESHQEAGRKSGLAAARVLECLGNTDQPQAVSLIAIHAHGIPTEFGAAALAEAEAAAKVRGLDQKALGIAREDLRDLPLVTIDPADARDLDDAVWAEPDADPANAGGWHIVVAIADVAYYVTGGGALDAAALERGNSVYFPDRVVHMLPAALSSDLCSLVPGQDRPVLAAHLWIDSEGRLARHDFRRALIRSAGKLSYGAVQAARDGRNSGGGEVEKAARGLLKSAIMPLYGAYEALLAGRRKRQPLDLDIPERRIMIGEDGHIASIDHRQRLDSHRLVEEMMIAANVAAAETLEARKTPCMYRTHDAPPSDKLEKLREFLSGLGLNLAKGQVLKPRVLNGILHKAAGTADEYVVSEAVLRSQSQALYSPGSTGHFGLELRRYAHFTSPIRRYADILVHRGLIRALGLGTDGLGEDEAARFEETGEHISGTERRAMNAERDATHRYVANFLADQIGAEFSGRISGVARFGLFVVLEDTGADGFIPAARIGDDYYRYDERRQAMVGRRTGETFTMGDAVRVRLAEASGFTASIRLEIVRENAPRPARKR